MATSKANQVIDPMAGRELAAQNRHFQEFYSRLVAFLTPSIPRDLQSILSAEEVAQEAFVAAMRDMAEFEDRGEGAFWAWLKGIADHRLADAIKRARRDKRGGGRRQIDPGAGASVSVSDPIGRLKPIFSTPSRNATRKELPGVLRLAMTTHLSEDEQRIVEMRHIQKLDWSDIAGRWDKTEESVRSIDYRALKRLKKALGSFTNLMSRG